jgi:prephenate dehydratase
LDNVNFLIHVVTTCWDLNGIYFLGPEGSFTHEAASLFGNQLIPRRTITEAIRSALNGGAAVVPVENSIEGPVNETLDGLYSFRELYVNAEVEKEIELVLATSPDVKDLSEIKKIYSHHHALKEASGFLQDLGVIDVEMVESTSRAAQLASSLSGSAAICSKFAAELYGLRVIRKGIQDHVNITRFFLISNTLTKSGDKTTIIFTLPHRPGSLFTALRPFAQNQVNLTMIYSRPLKTSPWKYYFYVEIEGGLQDPRVNLSLEEVGNLASELLIKGSYPKLRYQA